MRLKEQHHYYCTCQRSENLFIYAATSHSYLCGASGEMQEKKITKRTLPWLGIREILNDRNPRLKHGHCGRTHYSPHYKQHMRRHQRQRYDPSLVMGQKSNTTIIVPTREARPRLLIRQLLNRELAVPPDGIALFDITSIQYSIPFELSLPDHFPQNEIYALFIILIYLR
ncbi:hypothetical protein AVEN_208992-1 [Araneus ventricosus]|uniref:Uncharacterized protein n=1 Tax=Araneus ventricosus TaxID=182803 RepID=A0A4Y2CPG9_ARAVE|nr:hypothetical protein AVEN_208992-1 [Araneus ventricosus]